MTKVLIVYKSKYGSTARYANEIKEKMNADICKAEEAMNINLEKYETIVYGGRVVAGMIDGLKSFVEKYENNLKNKNFIIFAVGCTSQNSTEKINKLKETNKPQNIEAKIFYFRGALDGGNLSFLDKMMMKLVRSKAMKTPEVERSDDDKAIIDGFESKVDFFDKNAIKDLIGILK